MHVVYGPKPLILCNARFVYGNGKQFHALSNVV